MPAYRFLVTDCSAIPPVVKDQWTTEHPDDAAAWKECANVDLSGLQQVLVYRPGETVAFGSKASDELADVMQQQ